MSEQEQEKEAPEPPKSDHDLLIELRDLLKQLLEAVNAIEGGR